MTATSLLATVTFTDAQAGVARPVGQSFLADTSLAYYQQLLAESVVIVGSSSPSSSPLFAGLSARDDVLLAADADADGVGDLIFQTAGVERARIKSNGVGSGWAALNGGSIASLTVYGHSYAEGSGASRGGSAFWGSGMADLIGQLLNLSVDNRAVGGSGWMSATAPGIDALIMQNLPLSVGPPFGSLVQSAFIYSAINDMTNPVVIAEPSIIPDQAYACFLRLRAIAGDGTAGTTWAFAQGTGGTNWTTSGSGFVMGPPLHGATANGNTWTITLPSTFPGGDFYVLGIRQSGTGAVHTLTLDGAAYGSSWDTRGATQAQYRPTVFKMAGLAAGAHTIVGTVTNYVGGTEFLQGWLLDNPDAPAIAYAGANRAPAYPAGSHTIVDADVATVNTPMAAVASKFSDGRVIWIDADAILQKNSLYFDSVGYNGNANIHPNNTGHALIASAVAAALKPYVQASAVRGTDLAMPVGYMNWPRLLNAPNAFDKPRIGLATLDGTGSLVVTSRAILAESIVFLTPKTATGTVRVSAQTASSGVTAGTFTITSSAGASDSGKTVNWMIIDYAIR